ncbi:MAG: dihydrofolate reductase family protein [Myxococcota bacterium]
MPRRPAGTSRFRVASFTVSADGFGAGPDQSLEHPLGRGGEQLHGWFRDTDTFQRQHGSGHGVHNLDDRFAAYGFEGVGAWILGRNMFGPVRGAWPDASWRGWWGEDPPYHVPVFVLTHHARPPLEMASGTTFHFVTDGIEAALQRAREAAGPDRDVRLGGGVSSIRQYLQAGLLDELHLALAPTLLGRGEALWAGLDLPALGYEIVRGVATDGAYHVIVRRR